VPTRPSTSRRWESGFARALDAATAWARERTAFAHKIADYQGIQWMLADMATTLEAARS
jgi:butyryl-CoA dehydrogenase